MRQKMNSHKQIEAVISEYALNQQLSLSEKQYNQIFEYYDLMIEWNKVMNLTAITEPEEFARMHIIDSWLIHQVYPVDKAVKIMDVGTGAGLPGIPLKILYPHLQITLLDSLNKRVNFLNTVIERLGFEDMEAVHGRAEDIGKKDVYREAYDLVVSRAVSQLPVLSEYCIPFTEVDGVFIAYKSVNTDEEIEGSHTAIEKLGGTLHSVEDKILLGSDIPRRFVWIDKVKASMACYPRKAGTPSKKPL